MPKQPPKPGKKKDKTEERWVTWDDLDAGVHLKAGHPVILFLGGVHTPAATTTLGTIGGYTTQPPGEPGETTTTSGASPGGGTGEAPGTTTTLPGDSPSSPSSTTTQGGGGEPGSTTTGGGSYQPGTTTTGRGGSTPPTTTTYGSHDATGPDSPGGSTTQPPHDSTSSPATSTTQHSAPGTTTTQGGQPGYTTTQGGAPGNNPTTQGQPGHTTTQGGQPGHTTTQGGQPGHTTTQGGQPSHTTTIKKGKRYKLDADHFDNAKAFPKPEQAAFDTYKKVSQAVAGDSTLQLLILGHTDTKASDTYNLQLSDERAAAVKAFLLQDPSVWMPYYTNSDSQKKWGLLEDQYMLSALPDSGDGVVANKPNAYYTRAPSGRVNADFTAALKKFQGDAGEPATGTVNDSTRRKLIAAYMALEGTSVPSSTSIDSVGCSFRNQAEDPPTAMNVDSPTNRRTEIYAFYGPVTPPASAWNRADKSSAAPTYAAWRANTDDDSI